MEINIAVRLPTHKRFCLAWQNGWGVMRFDTEDPTFKRLFAEDPIHVIVKEKADVLTLACRLIERPHHGGAVSASR